MQFQATVTVAEVGERRTSAKGNEYVPVKLEHGNETYGLAAMGKVADQIEKLDLGSSVLATFEIRQFKKDISLQLKAIQHSETSPFD